MYIHTYVSIRNVKSFSDSIHNGLIDFLVLGIENSSRVHWKKLFVAGNSQPTKFLSLNS